ncbi:MAG: hypothetical protein V4730_12055 [Pseudomonadota bacterium]
MLAEKTGTIRVMEQTHETQINLMMTETLGRRTLREGQANRVDSNVFLSLPPGWGVYMAGPEVKLLQIAHVPVPKRREAITIKPAVSTYSNGGAVKIDNIFDLSVVRDD